MLFEPRLATAYLRAIVRTTPPEGRTPTCAAATRAAATKIDDRDLASIVGGREKPPRIRADRWRERSLSGFKVPDHRERVQVDLEDSVRGLTGDKGSPAVSRRREERGPPADSKCL